MYIFLRKLYFFIIFVYKNRPARYNESMDTNDAFLPVPEYVKIFVNRKEKELYLKSAGYNDFTGVKPQYYTHTQTHCTAHFVFGGSGVLNVGKNTFFVRKNQVFLLDNRCEFSYYPDKKTPWVYVWFDIGGAMAENYLRQCGFSPETPVAECRGAENVRAALRDLFTRAREGGKANYFDFLSALFELLSSVCKEESEPVFFYRDEYVEEIKRFIELKYLYDDFSVEYLAKSMHISHSHLCKIFKKSQGISVAAYVKALRLHRAAELLEKTEMSALDIAYASGFREYEYFLKCFKKRYGLTTRKYRAAYKR